MNDLGGKGVIHNDKAKELRMMKAAETWPLWPFLPVKKPKAGGGWPDCGVLADLGEGRRRGSARPVVYGHNVFSARPLDREKVVATYESLESMVDDGWVVD